MSVLSILVCTEMTFYFYIKITTASLHCQNFVRNSCSQPSVRYYFMAETSEGRENLSTKSTANDKVLQALFRTVVPNLFYVKFATFVHAMYIADLPYT